MCALIEADAPWGSGGISAAAQTGDQFYTQYFAKNKSVQGLLMREVPIREDREDILHDAYLSLIRSKGEFRGECSLKTYVYRVVQIAILQKLRVDRSRGLHNVMQLTLVIDGQERERELPVQHCQYEAVNATVACQRLLRILPEPLRTAFRLRATEELHCVVPGGGLSPIHIGWVHSRNQFLLPIKA